MLFAIILIVDFIHTLATDAACQLAKLVWRWQTRTDASRRARPEEGAGAWPRNWWAKIAHARGACSFRAMHSHGTSCPWCAQANTTNDEAPVDELTSFEK